MKRHILVLLLCALLLGGTVSAAYGEEEALVSLSYITQTFLPQVRAALAEAATNKVNSWQSSRASAFSGNILRDMYAGQSLLLRDGQQFTLIAGKARIFVDEGELINVTSGETVRGGAATANSRYIASENAAIFLDAVGYCRLLVSFDAEQTEGCPFQDVAVDSWYYNDVYSAYRRGLVNGIDDATFHPNGTLSGAECVKLASCMHQLVVDGSVTLGNYAEGPWYRNYADYALSQGLIDAEIEDYTFPVTRSQFIRIFYRALPKSMYTQINEIPDGAIPDVNMDIEDAAEIYSFYRAGILTGFFGMEGYDDYAFGPDTTITRAEVATIMNRMIDSTARSSFHIE